MDLSTEKMEADPDQDVESEQDESAEKDRHYMRTYNFTEEQLAELKESFLMFDTSNSDVILAQHVGTALRSMGQNPTEAEMQDLLQDANVDENGNVNMDEFMRLVGQRGIKGDMEMEEELEEALRVFDKNGEGCLDATELKNIMRTLGEPIDDDDIHEMMKVAEVAGDGKINYYEFMKKLTQK